MLLGLPRALPILAASGTPVYMSTEVSPMSDVVGPRRDCFGNDRYGSSDNSRRSPPQQCHAGEIFAKLDRLVTCLLPAAYVLEIHIPRSRRSTGRMFAYCEGDFRRGRGKIARAPPGYDVLKEKGRSAIAPACRKSARAREGRMIVTRMAARIKLFVPLWRL